MRALGRVKATTKPGTGLTICMSTTAAPLARPNGWSGHSTTPAIHGRPTRSRRGLENHELHKRLNGIRAPRVAIVSPALTPATAARQGVRRLPTAP